MTSAQRVRPSTRLYLRPSISLDHTFKLDNPGEPKTRQRFEQYHLLVSLDGINRLVPCDGLGRILIEGRQDLAGCLSSRYMSRQSYMSC